MLFVRGVLEGFLAARPLWGNWRPLEELRTGGGVVAKVGGADVGVVRVMSVGREGRQRREGKGGCQGRGGKERGRQWPWVHVAARTCTEHETYNVDYLFIRQK